MTRRLPGLLVIGLALGLAACSPGPTIEEIRASQVAACDAAGFEPGSDAHGLCLLLQDTNRRLDALENRLGFLELDVRSFYGTRLGSCRYPRC